MWRSLLRWTSLIASAAVLWALGVRRVHLGNFSLFFAVVVSLACMVVVVFLLTRGDEQN